MLCKSHKNSPLLIAVILSLLIKHCHSSVGGFVRHKDGIVSFGDFMVTSHSRALDELMEHLLADPTLTQEKRAQIYSEMATKYTLLPADDKSVRKVQLIGGKEGKQFTVSVVGHLNVLENLGRADKSGVDSLQSLAQLLEKVHAESAQERAKFGDKIRKDPHEFLVSDGTHIYGIEVGRTAREGGPRAPKITKKRGNVHVQGFYPEPFEQELKRHFRGRKRFGLFGKRMPVNMDSDSIKKVLIDAIKQHSTYAADPNPVSASFHAYFQDSKDNQSLREFQHHDAQEVTSLRNKLRRSEEDIVEGLVRKKLWQKTSKWNPNQWLYDMYWNAVNKIGLEAIAQGLNQRRSSLLSTGSSRRGSFNGRGNANTPAIPTHIDRPSKKLTKKSRNF